MLLLAMFTLVVSTAFAQSTRIGGGNRYETAVKISQSKFNTSDYVVLVTGENYPDALCAAPYAKLLNAPILLTQSQDLDKYTEEEIKRLKAKSVIIIGSNRVISDEIQEKINRMGINTERIYGKDRYETSVKIAEKIYDIKPYDEIFVASGENYPDALSAAPVAAIKEVPIILTKSNELPNVTKDYVEKLPIRKSYIVGGKTVVTDKVNNQFKNAIRLEGKDRFETNINVAKYFKDQLNFDNIYVAVGQGPKNTEFADALTGAVAAAKDSTAILLTKSQLTSTVDNFVAEYANKNTKLIVLGGNAAVSEEQRIKIENIISKLENKDNNTQQQTETSTIDNAQKDTTNNQQQTGISTVDNAQKDTTNTQPIDNTNSTATQNQNTNNQSTTQQPPSQEPTVLGFTKAQLQDISTRLSKCQSQAKSQNAKTLIGYAQTAVSGLIDNPNYDYSSLSNSALDLKSKMSSEEKTEVFNIIMNNFLDAEYLLNLYKLKSIFGL